LFVIDTWIMYTYMIITGVTTGGGFSDSSVLRVARLLRLTRMARMARLLRAMPELIILIKGMGAAMRSVGFTLILLLVLLYIFGVAFKQLCSDASNAFCATFFSSVPRSMHTLLIHGTLMDDLREFVVPLEEYSILLLFFFYCFLLLAALTVMNMLIGVLCDVVNTTAAIEKESLAILYVKERLQAIMVKTGMSKVSVFDGDERINKEEFLRILENRDAVHVLGDVGVDVVGLVDFADFIFKHDMAEDQDNDADAEERVLSFADFVEVLLQLRGNNNATVRDMVDLRKFVQLKIKNIDAKIDQILARSRQTSTEQSKRHRGTDRHSVTFSLDAGKAPSSPTATQGLASGPEETGASNASFELGPRLPDSDTIADGMDNAPLSPMKASTDKLLQACERRDMALGTGFRQLVERLVLEHESALAILQRGNERLQAELDVLKSASKAAAAARGESADGFSEKLDCLRTCYSPKPSTGKSLMEAQSELEDYNSKRRPSIASTNSSREQRSSPATPPFEEAVFNEAKLLTNDGSVNHGGNNNLLQEVRHVPPSLRGSLRSEDFFVGTTSDSLRGSLRSTDTLRGSLRSEDFSGLSEVLESEFAPDTDAAVGHSGNQSTASSTQPTARPAMPPMPSASTLSTLGSVPASAASGPLSAKSAMSL